MKNALVTLAAILVSTIGLAQTTSENYVKTTTYKTATPNGDVGPSNKIETVNYFDGLGRSKQTIGVNTGGNKTKNNLTPWKGNWVEGSGSAPFFNRNGDASENVRLMGTDPHGNESLLWRCGYDDIYGADGGWNTTSMSVDKNIGYRYSVWVKRTGSNNGHTYHGTKYVNNLDGTANNNPYFWVGDPPQLDTWYLMVGVIHPHTYTGGNSGISGVYDVNGNKVISGNDFKWMDTTVSSYFRSYLYYVTDINTGQYFYNPITQKLDGTESSIQDIINDLQYADIVTHTEYDDYGRQTKDYLPFTSANNNGLIIGNAKTKIHEQSFEKYPDDFPGITDAMNTNPYSEKSLEASPLNRVLKQAAPGDAWGMTKGKEIKFDYLVNDRHEVKNYSVTLAFANNTYTPTLVLNSAYESNELYKTITKDENHDGSTAKDHTTEEFKDKLGRVILKRTYNNEVKHDTYYVYDDYGNLTYVLPPKAEANTALPTAAKLNDLCYQYVYDHRNRLVEKKIPGKGWEYIVYNKLDQPILTQDANLDAQNRWLFTKYDAFGRITYTGKISGGASRTSLQLYIDGLTIPQYENKTTSINTLGGTTIYYTNNAYPTTSIDELLTINYFDDYNFDKVAGNSESSYGITPTTSVKSLATGSKIRVLGTNDWITTVTYYDDKKRPVYAYNHNAYLATTDKLKSKLNFQGQVEETTSTHVKAGVTTTVKDFFTYDHVGRVLSHKQKVNTQEEEVIARNHYDEFGQLVSKGIGGEASKGRLQEVDYDYNIRGWLKQINSPISLGNDLFGFKINYNTNDHGGTELFNGNIAETEWKTANDNTLRWYKYNYDDLNRIESAISPSGDYDLTNVDYDKNGNIIRLKRQGHTNANATTFGVMDDLNYIYDAGNRLFRVYEGTGGNSTYGFKDTGSTTSNDYSYDANGNMKKDDNKNITSITYNHLNLPTSIEIETMSGPIPVYNYINYTYDATGVKLEKKVEPFQTLGGATYTYYANNYIYEKLPLGNTTLKFFSQPEGYVEPDGNDFKYIYQYKDHLGNIRLSYQGEDGGYQSVLDTDFEEHYDGWIHDYTPTTELVDGRVKVNVMTAYEGIKKELFDYPFAAGDQYKVKVSFDKGNTLSDVRLYFTEFDGNNVFLRYKVLTLNLTTGSHEYNYTVGSGTAHVRLRINKTNTNTTSETHFYVDDVSMTQGDLEIVEENNYYPFGLKHKGYNNVVNGVENNRKTYQGQELDKELNLNWHNFKFRTYDASIGRFLQIDPLAPTYVYNSTYAFAENNVISGIDLEGLELSFELDGNRATAVKKDPWFGDNLMTLQQVRSEVSKKQTEREAAMNRIAKLPAAKSKQANIQLGSSHPQMAKYSNPSMMVSDGVGIGMTEASMDILGVGLLNQFRKAKTVWNLGRFERGRRIERMLGANLKWPSNFPTIDKVVNSLKGGVATSIKSIDLDAKTYNQGNKLLSTLKGYINKLDNFTSRSWGGTVIDESDYTSKALELAVQTGKGSKDQWRQINDAVQYALDKDINVTIRFID